MSSTIRQTWDEANYKKMWVAFLKTHPGIHVNHEMLAVEMGATKRALEDQIKALRREARALQTPAGASAASEESESEEEEQLNVYQRAKRGLPPRGMRRTRGAPTTARGKAAMGKSTKYSATANTTQEGAEGMGVHDKEGTATGAPESRSKPQRHQQDIGGEEDEGEDEEDDDGMTDDQT